MSRPETASKRPAVLLSFDAEEFDISLEYGIALSESEHCRIGTDGFERTLLLLGELDLRATFFTTAAIALRYAAPTCSPCRLGGARNRPSRVLSFALRVRRCRPESRSPAADRRRRCRRVSHAPLAPVDPALLRDAGYLYDSSSNPIWRPAGTTHSLRHVGFIGQAA